MQPLAHLVGCRVHRPNMVITQQHDLAFALCPQLVQRWQTNLRDTKREHTKTQTIECVKEGAQRPAPPKFNNPYLQPNMVQRLAVATSTCTSACTSTGAAAASGACRNHILARPVQAQQWHHLGWRHKHALLLIKRMATQHLPAQHVAAKHVKREGEETKHTTQASKQTSVTTNVLARLGWLFTDLNHNVSQCGSRGTNQTVRLFPPWNGHLENTESHTV